MTLIVAHRGAAAVAPENSVEAFRAAARLGADMVELDARRTADGAVVVRHDPVAPGLGPLCAVASTDLHPSIALLADALDACAGMDVNIEIKNLPGEPDWEPTEQVAEAVVAQVADVELQPRVVVSSFNLASVDRVRDLDPTIRTSWLTLAGYDQAEAVRTCVEHGHTGIHPQDGGITADLVARAHEAGLWVMAWTVDDADRMRQLAEWGVDAICTNVPDLAVRVLR